MAPCEIVMVSGFTAAGKTTHARALARELGWEYLGMSQIRRRLLPESASARAEWTPRGDELHAADPGLDLAVVALLLRRLGRR